MKRTIAIVLLLAVPMLSCGRRVTVTSPTAGRVIINDRVVDIISDRALAEAISKVPPAEQAALIKELIASKERLAAQQMNVEDRNGVSFWGTVLKIIELTLPIATGYYIAK